MIEEKDLKQGELSTEEEIVQAGLVAQEQMASRFLTREEILQADDIPEEIVACPEWGGNVLVRGLTLGEAHKVIEEMGEGGERDVQTMNLWAITRGARGADGKPLFTEADHEALLLKSSAACLRLTKAFIALSGLSDDVLEKTEKNSSETDGSA